MPVTETQFGYVRSESVVENFAAQSASNRLYDWTSTVEFDGIEFDISAFDGVTGFVPTGEELYDLLGPTQLKRARQGAIFAIKVRYAIDNHNSPIGSEEEAPLMDHEYRVEKLIGKPKFVKKLEVL